VSCRISKVPLILRLPPALHQELQAYVKHLQKKEPKASQNDVIIKALAHYLRGFESGL
jgi:hypothetical protein